MRHTLEPRDYGYSGSRSWIVAACVLGTTCFFALAVAVATGIGQIEMADEAIFAWLRDGAPSEIPWFTEAVRDVSSLGSLSILIGTSLIAVAYLALLGRWRAAFQVFVAAAGGIALGMGLKIPFDRARPDLLLHESQVFTRSFPSAHATTSAAVLLTLGGLVARARNSAAQRGFILAVVALIIILIGASRIFLGVHWPSDVAAGGALGSAWACGCWLVLVRRRDQLA
jgi:undecaprenyl-diphosphatase